MKGTKEIIKYILCCECLKKDKNDDNKYNVTKKVANDNRGFSINEDTVIVKLTCNSSLHNTGIY